jgi:hypothetical protein
VSNCQPRPILLFTKLGALSQNSRQPYSKSLYLCSILKALCLVSSDSLNLF